jgi:DNA-binding MarR family transcriptional regulator
MGQEAPVVFPGLRLESSSLLAQARSLADLIRKLCQAEETFSKELDKEFNVSLPQLKCLIALDEDGPLPPSRLAPYVMANSSTVTGIIDRLERKNLVSRSRTSRDRRMVSISITEEGKALVQKVPFPIQPNTLRMLARLTAHERQGIIEALTRLTTMP